MSYLNRGQIRNLQQINDRRSDGSEGSEQQGQMPWWYPILYWYGEKRNL